MYGSSNFVFFPNFINHNWYIFCDEANHQFHQRSQWYPSISLSCQVWLRVEASLSWFHIFEKLKARFQFIINVTNHWNDRSYHLFYRIRTDSFTTSFFTYIVCTVNAILLPQMTWRLARFEPFKNKPLQWSRYLLNRQCVCINCEKHYWKQIDMNFNFPAD